MQNFMKIGKVVWLCIGNILHTYGHTHTYAHGLFIDEDYVNAQNGHHPAGSVARAGAVI